MGLKERKTEIKGLPVELIKVDEETGELCVGDECFMVKYEPRENTIAIEFNPNSQTCSPLMRRVSKMFLKQITESKPKVKFREKRRLDDEE